MSLRHALLGFLNYAPMTGYDLKKHFDNSVNHFWRAELSQIYPTLDQMAQEGLVTREGKDQKNAHNSRAYYITEAGRKELQRWLEEPCDLAPHREAFLIKIFFGAALESSVLLRLLEGQLKRHRERLAAYQQILARFEEIDANRDPRLIRELPFQRYTVRAGVLSEEARIAWCEETIAAIRGRRGDN